MTKEEQQAYFAERELARFKEEYEWDATGAPYRITSVNSKLDRTNKTNKTSVDKKMQNSMKRVLVFLIIAFQGIISVSCIATKTGDSMYDLDYKLSLHLGQLSVYESSNRRLVRINKNNGIINEAEFSLDRQCISNKGITLLIPDGLQSYLDVKLADIVDMVGSPHADTGSGFYIPTYVCENAKLLMLMLNTEETVIGITVQDLLTNQIERIISEK